MAGRANGAADAAGEAAGTPPQDVGAAVGAGSAPPEAGSLLGRRVSKLFSRKRYLGAVTAFCTEEQWYTITYEDGCAGAASRRRCACANSGKVRMGPNDAALPRAQRRRRDGRGGAHAAAAARGRRRARG